ncbi:enoyl-CoA hydratase/isomerase family protein [Rhodococcus rhodochrous]|uniref:Enoyl-CoA hydratase n=1 Tax=Rhodococcus rhodochrous J45 TaxID=935266 RepID=A0A562E8P4_RHORH|nr:enoyl-CoA hydratase/isomerase family protein [Rhodococcus rhodochrous]MCB8913526.1 enoyl-CoA hydratase/isomerase family protein [Rhodococcus rhodochrous]TWH17988.1 enoyl-CoA hydratase [Rhodococcus rhodochrous J45]
MNGSNAHAESDLVTTEVVEEGVHVLVLNRPDRLNAITPPLIDALHRRLDEADADRSCRAVILTGAGRGFCAGADLRGGDDHPDPFEPRPGPVGTFQVQEQYSRTTTRLRALSKPVIAAVNGPATGGGLAFVLGCDIRLAATSARFSAAFAKIGLSGCDMGTGWLLNRVVGIGRAHELLLTGRIIEAEEALRIGLVLEVVPDELLLERALEFARLIKANSPFGTYMTKQVMWSTVEIPGLDAAMALENRTQVLASTTNDSREAIAAFLERREPRWTDS